MGNGAGLGTNQADSYRESTLSILGLFDRLLVAQVRRGVCRFDDFGFVFLGLLGF